MTGDVARDILHDDGFLERIFPRSRQEGPVRSLATVQILLNGILDTIQEVDDAQDSVLSSDEAKQKILAKLERQIASLKRTVLILLNRNDCCHLPDYLHIVIYHVTDLLRKHGKLNCFNQRRRRYERGVPALLEGNFLWEGAIRAHEMHSGRKNPLGCHSGLVQDTSIDGCGCLPQLCAERWCIVCLCE